MKAPTPAWVDTSIRREWGASLELCCYCIGPTGHLQLCGKPIVPIMTVFSSASFVQFIGSLTNLFLSLLAELNCLMFCAGSWYLGVFYRVYLLGAICGSFSEPSYAAFWLRNSVSRIPGSSTTLAPPDEAYTTRIYGAYEGQSQ